jgi:hypothetical protein
MQSLCRRVQRNLFEERVFHFGHQGEEGRNRSATMLKGEERTFSLKTFQFEFAK